MSSVKLYQQVANAISPQLRHLAEPPAAAEMPPAPVAQAAPPAPTIPPMSLRRTGERPYVFSGKPVATLSGYSTQLPFWYEINVYQDAADEYVTDLRLFHKDPNSADMFRVVEHDDMDSIFEYLERYDPSADLDPGKSIAEPTASSAMLALNAARLQLRVNQLTRHYQAVVGDLLQALHKLAS
jgi:hypothetical protein